MTHTQKTDNSQEKQFVTVMDTTLRDGIQAAPRYVRLEERMIIADYLMRMKIQNIEAGFPVSGEEFFETARYVAGKNKHETTVLARAVENDIRVARSIPHRRYWHTYPSHFYCYITRSYARQIKNDT